MTRLPMDIRPQYSPEFEEFWKAYPKRPNPAKDQASVAHKKALKHTSNKTLIDSLEGYKAYLGAKIGTEYVLQARTYLNEKRYLDYVTEPEPPPPAVEVPEDERAQVLYREFGPDTFQHWFKDVTFLGHKLDFPRNQSFKRDYVVNNFGDKLRKIGFSL